MSPIQGSLRLGHHLSGRKEVSFSELAEEPFIARTHCESRALIGELLKEKGVRLNVVYKTNQDDRAISLVEVGVGIAIIPQHYASTSIAKISLADLKAERQIGFEWTGESNKEEIEKFVDFSKTVPWAH